MVRQFPLSSFRGIWVLPYKITLEKAAEKYLRRQSKDVQVRLLKAVKGLPPATGGKKLIGTRGYFRIRVGNIRIIFTINEIEHSVNVIAIGPRGQVYRDI